jgi:hypothetical protein
MENSRGTSSQPISIIRRELEVSRKRVRDYRQKYEETKRFTEECELSIMVAEGEVEELLFALKELQKMERLL